MGYTGGTQPHFYQWSTGASKSNLNGLSPGTYMLAVSDANGCTQVVDVVIRDSCTFNDISIQSFKAHPTLDGQAIALDGVLSGYLPWLTLTVERYDLFEEWQPIGSPIVPKVVQSSVSFSTIDSSPMLGQNIYRASTTHRHQERSSEKSSS